VYTDQLWASKKYRKQGIARKIMENVHDYGRNQKCSIATIQTMEFQGAVEFYKKLGYIQDFKRSGYINNCHCIFMKKELIDNKP
jgi:GNAT superfamily N-acetyltransferase